MLSSVPSSCLSLDDTSDGTATVYSVFLPEPHTPDEWGQRSRASASCDSVGTAQADERDLVACEGMLCPLGQPIGSLRKACRVIE